MAANNGATSAVQTAPKQGMDYVAVSELKDLCTKSLKTLGYTDDEVKVLLEVGCYDSKWYSLGNSRVVDSFNSSQQTIQPCCLVYCTTKYYLQR